MSGSPDSIRLTFTGPDARNAERTPLRHDISAVAAISDTIFVACDETATVERLSLTGDGGYGRHERFHLAEFFDLPGGDHGEMDIEGLDVSDGYLWITGSHALKRGKAEREELSATESLDSLAKIKRDANCYFLGCVPLAEDGDGQFMPVKKTDDLRAACIKLKKNKSTLLRWLKSDDHLGMFLDIPSKENGLDIEGIAARGSRVWLGLRGPVLRGHAVILELDLKRPKRSLIKPRKIDKGRRYRKHVIPSRGLGVRDLCFDGKDLLVLLGTPLGSDGPARVMRWENAVHDTKSGVVDPDRLSLVHELPYRDQFDHPEGIDIIVDPETGRKRLVVVHDSPSSERLTEDPPSLLADVYRMD